jgi:hypothetical protein
VEMSRTKNSELRTQDSESGIQKPEGCRMGFSPCGLERGTERVSRRRFLGGVMGIVAGAAVAGPWLARRWAVEEVVTAEGIGRYPGRVVPLGRVDAQAKWRG